MNINTQLMSKNSAGYFGDKNFVPRNPSSIIKPEDAIRIGGKSVTADI